MPSFNPRGFQYSRSLTASQPFANGLQTFLWNKELHGFAGDLCCNNLYNMVENTPMTPLALAPTGFVYPVPLTTAPIGYTPPSGVTITYPSIVMPIGVISSFKYYPAALNKGSFIVSSTYPKGTALQDNTYVEVQVVVDPYAVYSIQMKNDIGLIYNQVGLQYAYVAADYNANPALSNVYQADISTNHYLFPYGVFEGNGAFAGSRCYLGPTTTSADVLALSGGTAGASVAILLNPTLGIEGNGLSAASSGSSPSAIAPLVPNPILDVSLANQFINMNYFNNYIATPAI